jgi:hypothetical protein
LHLDHLRRSAASCGIQRREISALIRVCSRLRVKQAVGSHGDKPGQTGSLPIRSSTNKPKPFSRRKAVGVTPTNFRNTRFSWDASLNPPRAPVGNRQTALPGRQSQALTFHRPGASKSRHGASGDGLGMTGEVSYLWSCDRCGRGSMTDTT